MLNLKSADQTQNPRNPPPKPVTDPTRINGIIHGKLFLSFSTFQTRLQTVRIPGPDSEPSHDCASVSAVGAAEFSSAEAERRFRFDR